MGTTVKTNKTKSCFFEKINKIDRQLGKLIKKKWENQINNIRNEKGEITTEIQIIIRSYYEQIFANKMDHLKEMDIFLETLNLPRLNQEEIEIMNKPITCTEIENVIKKNLKKLKHRA